ncbi:cytochrome P450 [Polyplosphaeria fusca]|uniref:Cytochrome P450 n=1 Tax=Polyplosphaeria fusca TaxID=682080 RepID=A0A9P4RA35_9PLEO|nr:cytochrome P450 [Polyplosphaeria fusca]
MMATTQVYLVTIPLFAILSLLYRLYTNYLALASLRLPGPFLAKLSSKWLFLTFARGQQANTVHALHRRHGPIVQIGPREISFASAQACKDIYGVHTKCSKSAMYDNFAKPGLVGMRDRGQHRERLQRVAHVFSLSVLKELEPSVQDQIAQLRALLVKSEGTAVDVVKLMHLLALDVAGIILLGENFGALGAERPSYYVKVMKLLVPFRGVETTFPWAIPILKVLPFEWARDFTGVVDYVYGYCEERMKRMIEEDGRTSQRKNMLSRLLVGDPEKGTLPLTDQEISDEVGNFIYAASDTTGIVMAYFLYEMAANIDWQEKLRKEIKDAKVEDGGFDYAIVQKLPVLQACLYESLRLHPGAPVGLPRTTPIEGFSIDGIFVPGGTIVHAPSFTVQRDTTAFPSPDKFDPGRWLSASGSYAPSTQLLDHMMIWGAGEYRCAGINMAIMEVKTMVSRVLNNFKVRVESEQTHEDMKPKDHFMTEASGGRGMCVFESIDS